MLEDLPCRYRYCCFCTWRLLKLLVFTLGYRVSFRRVELYNDYYFEVHGL